MEDVIRVAIIGDTNVGKTTFLKAFAHTYRRKNSKSSFRLEFANSATADFLRDYYQMLDGKFPDSTLEHSKVKLRWRLFLSGVDSPVYLESVDPIGQYISNKIQGGKKRAEEYERQIDHAEVALIFIDSVALKSVNMCLSDYKELFDKCRERKCKTAILLTKSDLLYGDNLNDAKGFLERYFPELDCVDEHVQFISIGEKKDFQGKRILDIYSQSGFEEFSDWLVSSVFFDCLPRTAFLDSVSAERIRELREQLELKKRELNMAEIETNSTYTYCPAESHVDYLDQLIKQKKGEKERLSSGISKGAWTGCGIGAVIGGICFGPLGAVIGGGLGGYGGRRYSDDKVQIRTNLEREIEELRRQRDIVSDEVKELRLQERRNQKKCEDIRREIQGIEKEIERLLSSAEDRRSIFKKKVISSAPIRIFTYDVFNKNFQVNNYWNIQDAFLENSDWVRIIQKASDSSDSGIISRAGYCGIFKIFEKNLPPGERRQWYAKLLLVARKDGQAVDALRVLASVCWDSETFNSVEGLKEAEDLSEECLFEPGEQISGAPFISEISRKITSSATLSRYQQYWLLIDSKSSKANIYYI